MANNIKYYDLELHNNILKKVVHNETKQELFIFNIENKDEVAKLDLDFKNNSGVYLISKRTVMDDVYIGQTTKGVRRFSNRHNFLVNKEDINDYKVFFFKLDFEYVHKSILDYLEMNLISKISFSKNKIKDINSKLNQKDENYAKTILNNIYDLLEVYDFNLPEFLEEDSIIENIKTSLGDSMLIKRKKKDVLDCALDYLEIKGTWVSFEELTHYTASKYKEDLESGRWKDRYGFNQALSRDLQEVCEGYKINTTIPLLEKKEDERSYRIKRN